MLCYVQASLPLVKVLGVALAMIGSDLSRSSVLSNGWFGPRRLASIVLGSVLLERKLQSVDESVSNGGRIYAFSHRRSSNLRSSR